ncbi:hypothetical protein [Nitrosophilus alvini]|uniref:hypothetical protein n=1 Tax=Nitrosophilus alvini TaxID=2714855 RepID=UPI00190981A0|nr:hypothetical protein [Nitrosophilus alvini]
MKKVITYLFLATFFLFSGCSSKQYFEPEEIAGKVEYDGELPAKIIDITRDGATLENGQVITKSGVLDIKIPKDFEFVSDNDEYVIAAHSCGDMVIISKKSGKEVLRHHFDMKRVAAAKMEGDIVVLVFDNNEIGIFDWKEEKVLNSIKSDEIFSVDTKIANPYFMEEIILVPTLDGKIIIVDKKTKKAIRTIIVGTEKFLNNIIFLDVLNNRLVAATPNKVISVNPEDINTLDMEISDILFLNEGIYILAKDGRVVLTDADLNVLKTRKYPFAHFTGVIYGEYLYIIEKEGYMIATDHTLRVSNIFKLPDEIDDYIFAAEDRFYYKDRYFQLQK